jgi:L-alanine-DL-glutamate epimerase-like enolase superfamily enzyme
MRIESIEATAVVVPLRVPATFSTRELQGREYVSVQVVDESGASGIGYAGDSGGAWLGSGSTNCSRLS